MKRVSRRDVARRAGVSEAAVSYVLNGKAGQNRIPPKTVERVRRISERMGYRPNIYGKILKTQKSSMLAFVSQDLTDPNTAEIIRTLGAMVRKRGYGLMLMDLGGREAVSREDLRTIETSFADGFFLHAPAQSLMDLCAKGGLLGKPFCVLGRQFAVRDVPFVEVDNALGAEMGVRHLIENGSRDIGIAADRKAYTYTRERMKGCRRALAGTASCALRTRFRAAGEDQFHAGVSAVAGWAREGRFPDGIFAMGDVIAIGALHCLNARGIACPRRVKVVGFDGIPFGEYVSPPLTTVAQPFEGMCEAAMDVLEADLTGHEVRDRQRLCAPKIVLRASSARTEKGEAP